MITLLLTLFLACDNQDNYTDEELLYDEQHAEDDGGSFFGSSDKSNNSFIKTLPPGVMEENYDGKGNTKLYPNEKEIDRLHGRWYGAMEDRSNCTTGKGIMEFDMKELSYTVKGKDEDFIHDLWVEYQPSNRSRYLVVKIKNDDYIYIMRYTDLGADTIELKVIYRSGDTNNFLLRKCP